MMTKVQRRRLLINRYNTMLMKGRCKGNHSVLDKLYRRIVTGNY